MSVPEKKSQEEKREREAEYATRLHGPSQSSSDEVERGSKQSRSGIKMKC